MASLITFIIGIIGAILCITLETTTEEIVGYFFGFVALMQGIEYILWKNQECNIINKAASLIGMILNHIQPIILSIIILSLNKNLSKNTKQIIILSTIIYTIVITIYSLQFINDNDGCTLKNEYDHLKWDWTSMNYNIVYLLFLFMLVFLFYVGTPDRNSGIILAIISFISYIISYFIYGNKNVVGPLWCIFASFTPILWYVYKKLIL